ncbi:MAG TPA: hypothetical protein VJU61_20510, partial [Polyangiaceae bacterium]|nr:hypothetical protein [Polyangiaceae bacterium]
PMTTQTLRGLANQGAQHWRGDRTRRFAEEPGRQPNFGALDEDSSFGEFDVAIRGLNGNDVELDPELFQDFTNFSLQLSLPPNPHRALDGTLTPERERGRALYFGCASMSDADFESRQCTALDGSRVDVDQATQDCFCATSPVVSVLAAVPSIAGFAGLLQALLANPELSQALLGLAGDTSLVPAEQQPRVAELASQLALTFENLLTSELAPNQLGIFSFETAGTLAGLSGQLLGVLQISAAYATPQGPQLLDLLASSIPPDALPASSPLRFAAGLQQSFASMFAVANLNLRVSADEAARGTSAFRDLLGGCDVRQPAVCRLRVTDSFDTCHGCHTLDPRGNAEFDVYRPGFFGTSGSYSFENESQMFKVPQLRNLYQKVGMFGQAQLPEIVPESTLGPNRGGFFAAQNQHTGPQVRGFGFLHDGSLDTLHRFHGAGVFRQSYPGAPLRAPGTADGLSATIPALATRSVCVQRFRSAAPSSLEGVPGALREDAAWCLESSGIPDGCFIDPLTEDCQAALGALAQARGEPAFADRFVQELRDTCFQFGSALEGGAAEGACYPQGLVERAELEAFLLAFDTNLQPMVGQQVTIEPGRWGARAFVQLLFVAARGQCDAALRQGDTGYLVALPDAVSPADSRLEGARGEVRTLGELSHGGPVTVTCYPPQAHQAEARRAAFSRARVH